jgi:hypothetical protein
MQVLATGIGSLPFARYDAALRHVFASYSLPFYPQLPQAGGSDGAGATDQIPQMLREILTPEMLAALQRRDGTALVMHLEHCISRGAAAASDHVTRLPGFDGFCERAADAAAVKSQLMGPGAATAVAQSLLPDLPQADLRAAFGAWITQLTLAKAARLHTETRADLYLLWDDSQLALEPLDTSHPTLAALASQLPPRTRFGVHSCMPMPLARLANLGPGYTLAVDTSVIDVTSPAVRDVARRHLERGGRFVYGVFDTRYPKIDAASGMAMARGVIDVVKSVATPPPVIISGGCGTGLRPVRYEEALVSGLQAAAALLAAAS